MIKLIKEYIDDLLVRSTHHSSAIENNTITLNETVSILLHQTIPSGVSVREFYEVDNHRMAFEHLINQIDKDLTLTTIHETHFLLLDRLHHERGRFKTQANAVVGASFNTATPSETPLLMHQWVENVNYQMGHAKTADEVIKAVCRSHIEFERIHPYADGNGRTGRLLIIYLLLKSSIFPLVINKQDKSKYVLYLANQDTDNFSEYAKKKIEQEKERYYSFFNSLPKE